MWLFLLAFEVYERTQKKRSVVGLVWLSVFYVVANKQIWIFHVNYLIKYILTHENRMCLLFEVRILCCCCCSFTVPNKWIPFDGVDCKHIWINNWNLILRILFLATFCRQNKDHCSHHQFEFIIKYYFSINSIWTRKKNWTNEVIVAIYVSKCNVKGIMKRSAKKEKRSKRPPTHYSLAFWI